MALSKCVHLRPQAQSPASVLKAMTAGPGWVQRGYWDVAGREVLTSFRGCVKVPPPPGTAANQVIFLLFALQAGVESVQDFILPVLQWGESASGGGNVWAMGCWYVFNDNERTLFSDLVEVEPGATIEMEVTRVMENQYGELWRCSATDGNEHVELLILGKMKPRRALVALEAYNVADCTSYPAADSTVYAELTLEADGQPASPQWTAEVMVEGCGRKVEIVSPSQVELFYRSPASP